MNKVKMIIDSLQGKKTIDVICELVDCKYYLLNTIKFYHFFGWEGGTITQLSLAILKRREENLHHGKPIIIS